MERLLSVANGTGSGSWGGRGRQARDSAPGKGGHYLLFQCTPGPTSPAADIEAYLRVPPISRGPGPPSSARRALPPPPTPPRPVGAEDAECRRMQASWPLGRIRGITCPRACGADPLPPSKTAPVACHARFGCETLFPRVNMPHQHSYKNQQRNSCQQLSPTANNRQQPSTTVNRRQQPPTIKQPSTTVDNHEQLSTTVNNHQQSSTTINNRQQPPTTDL